MTMGCRFAAIAIACALPLAAQAEEIVVSNYGVTTNGMPFAVALAKDLTPYRTVNSARVWTLTPSAQPSGTRHPPRSIGSPQLRVATQPTSKGAPIATGGQSRNATVSPLSCVAYSPLSCWSSP